jgi:MoaF N-terminal domain
MPETTTSLAGRRLKWTFDSGPTAGASFEHAFHPDGTVEFRKLEGGKPGAAKREKRYAAFEVAPDVQLVSYLAESGYTLTVAMNLAAGRIYGFASNDKEWYPVSGTVESIA